MSARKIFCAHLRTLIRMAEIFDELHRLGFDCDRGVCDHLGQAIDYGLASLNDALGLQKCEGQTTLDWWWENRDSDDDALRTITHTGPEGVHKVLVDSPEDLYDEMVRLKEVAE